MPALPSLPRYAETYNRSLPAIREAQRAQSLSSSAIRITSPIGQSAWSASGCKTQIVNNRLQKPIYDKHDEKELIDPPLRTTFFCLVPAAMVPAEVIVATAISTRMTTAEVATQGATSVSLRRSAGH